MLQNSKSFSNRRLALGLIALLLCCLALMPGTALADTPSVEQISEAIKEQGLNWTPREYSRTFATGLLFDGKSEQTKELPAGPKVAALPSSLDWRNQGGNFVSSVKDQANCGSCWAFAGVGAFESLYAISNGTPGSFLDLSEQILVSCCADNYGCDGGYMNVTANFLRTEGTYYESCFSYTATDNYCSNACSGWEDNAFKIDSYQFVSQSADALKAAVQSGPLQVAFTVFDDFDSYGGGVYECTEFTADPGGHAVLLVGYEDTVGGQYGGGYFIVKNSWGTSWGESGYFRIGYSQVTNAVGFGEDSYSYTVSSSPPGPTPTPGPEPYEPNDTCSEAFLISVGTGPQTHNFHDYGDQDWIEFEARAGHSYVIETSNLGYNCDTVMYLYSTDCSTLIGQNDDIDYWAGNIASRIEWNCSTTGTYSVRVKQYWPSDYGNGTEYDVSVRAASVSLQTGWNLASYPTQWSRSTATALSSIAGRYTLVYEYLPSDTYDPWKKYDPAAPSWSNDLITMYSGRNYWIRASASCLWEVE